MNAGMGVNMAGGNVGMNGDMGTSAPTPKNKKNIIISAIVVFVVAVAALLYFGGIISAPPQVDTSAFDEMGADFNQNNLTGVIDTADAVLKTDGKNVEALLASAIAWAQKGSLEFKEAEYGVKAIELANQVLAIDPNNAEAYRIIGYANEIQNKFQDALAAYDTSLRLLPDNALVDNQIGHTYDLMGDMAKAKENYIKANSIKNDIDQVHMNLGRVYAREGNIEAAVTEFEMALVLAENARLKAEIFYTLGNFKVQSNDITTAMEYMEHSVAADPEYPLAYVGLGKVQFLQVGAIKDKEAGIKHLAGAIADLNVAIDKNPNQTIAYMIKGKIYAMVGDIEEARKNFTSALEVVERDITLVGSERDNAKKEAEAALKGLPQRATSINTHTSDKKISIGGDGKFVFGRIAYAARINLDTVAIENGLTGWLDTADQWERFTSLVLRLDPQEFALVNGGSLLTCDNGVSWSKPVPPPPPPSPSVTLSANPTSVIYNTASTLTWSSSSVTSCTASGGWTGSRGTAGTQSTGNLTATQTYNLQCTGLSGPAQASATVTVAPPSGSGGKPQCQDGVDNDNDGWKDYPADPGCASANNDRETNIPLAQCSDSADNDGDGKIDGKDPECANAYDNNETPVPDFALNKSNDIQVTIVGGIAQASNSSTITVDSQETFAGPVTLSAQGISPSIAGIAYSFGDTTLSSTEYSGGTPFSVTVPAGTNSGAYVITLKGVSTGPALTRTINVNLVVQNSDPQFQNF